MGSTIQVLTILLAGLTCNLVLAETILINREIPFGKGVFIPSSVANECQIGREFSDYLSASIGEQGFTVQLTDDSLRERAAIAERVAKGNVRRARVDLRIADIELKAANLAVQEAATEREKSGAEFRAEYARVKRASALLIIERAEQSSDSPPKIDPRPVSSDKYLFIEIDRIDAASVGAFSMDKRKLLHVAGEYRQGMELIASFVGQRATWARGLRGGAKPACKMIRKNIKDLAEDIGDWMKSPRDDAGLGELEECALGGGSKACQPK